MNEAQSEMSNQQVWDFVSAPALHPMKVSINLHHPRTAPGLLFVAPFTLYEAEMVGQTGALIMDQAGNPVWFRPLPSIYLQNADFRMQSYCDRPVLTTWQGTISGTQSADPNLPAGSPEPGACYLIFDQHYRVVETVTARQGYTADVHEFTITPRNTALFTAIKVVSADLRRYGGPKEGYIEDCAIQEVDLATGKLLYSWSALAHINPGNSMLPASSATSSHNIWDCYHMNSIQEGPGNTLLVSMRNMWAIYQIDKRTGKIIWQLGGKKSDFALAPEARFSWQHDARCRPGDRISLFDDACCASSTSPPQGPARGLILKLNFKKKTAQVDRTYYHDPALMVPSQGNLQHFANGNKLVGWGQRPYLSESANAGNSQEDPSQNLLYDMQFPGENETYRAYKNKWVGLPLDPPRIAVSAAGEEVATVYASWNGSTETVAWRVLAGPKRDELCVVIESAPRSGFETQLVLQVAGRYFQVQALNACGQVIGESPIVCGHPPEPC